MQKKHAMFKALCDTKRSAITTLCRVMSRLIVSVFASGHVYPVRSEIASSDVQFLIHWGEADYSREAKFTSCKRGSRSFAFLLRWLAAASPK